MANLTQDTVALANANAAAIVASNTPAGAGNLTIVGGSPFTMDAPRRVRVTFGVEATARLIQFFGTDRNGNAINETLTVPSGAGGTADTQQDFATVTRVAVFAAWSAAMTVGTSPVGSSAWKSVNQQITPVQIGLAVVVSGTVNYTVEYTYEDPNAATMGMSFANGVAPTPFPLTALAAQTTSKDSNITWPIRAYRLTVNSSTSPGQATLNAVPAGMSN